MSTVSLARSADGQTRAKQKLAVILRPSESRRPQICTYDFYMEEKTSMFLASLHPSVESKDQTCYLLLRDQEGRMGQRENQ